MYLEDLFNLLISYTDTFTFRHGAIQDQLINNSYPYSV